MKLHTREQAPKEGGTDAPPKQGPWVPTRIGYARFLSESKVVFSAFESIMAAADGHPECECVVVVVVSLGRAGARKKIATTTNVGKAPPPPLAL